VPRFSFARWMKSFLGFAIINKKNRDGERMDTGNREIIKDRRRIREAAGRCYLTAFDI
jgi:hypothetical protein